MAASEKENYTGRNISGRRARAPGAQAPCLSTVPEHQKLDFAEGPQTVQIPIITCHLMETNFSPGVGIFSV